MYTKFYKVFFQEFLFHLILIPEFVVGVSKYTNFKFSGNFRRKFSNRLSPFGKCSNSSINGIIQFPYNAHSDWLKQRALSENRERVDDGKLAFKFLLRNFDKFDPN